MKTYVIILSKRFPSGHRSAGQETHFAESVANGTKIHTIRDNFELWDKRVNDVFCGRAEISIRSGKGNRTEASKSRLCASHTKTTLRLRE